MAFVAMGFDHVVANMFFLPAAIFTGAGDVTWGDAVHNWVFAGLGNLVGAAVFVAGAYWYLYAKDEDVEEAGGIRGDVDGALQAGNGAGEPARATGASSQPAG
jgi:hypothetical protein